jgi:hypothetical protein
MLFLRHIYRVQKEYMELKIEIPQVLAQHNCRLVKVEDATNASAIGGELRALGYQVETIPTRIPGQKEGSDSRGAKFERAIASGLFTMVENGWISLPDDKPQWVRDYLKEIVSWKGRPNDTADQVDVTSYASYHCRNNVGRWESIGAVPIASTVGGFR